MALSNIRSFLKRSPCIVSLNTKGTAQSVATPVLRGATKPPLVGSVLLAVALAMTAAPALAQDTSPEPEAEKDTKKDDGNESDGKEDEYVEIDEDYIPEQDGEVVVVSGFGNSIKASTDRKRFSSSIVEAITAEDIGKLPDVSIAESIARLPGLAAQRLDGRANVISLRGLAPDFTTTTLNGREQVSANNNRAVEFDQFPAELIHGVTVYKTPDASIAAQAVGGTVNLQTVSPLRYGKQALTANIRGEYNDLGALNAGSTAMGYRTSISYIDQFADDTVGIALGYARMSSPTQEERWNTWGYPNVDGEDENSPLVIGGAKPYVKSNELVRDGLMAVVELKPKDEKFTTTLDAYYSRFNDTQLLRGIEIPLYWSAAQLQDGYVTEDGLVTSGQFNGTEAVVRNDVVNREADTLAVGWNTKYEANDNWNFVLDFNYSRVDRTENNLETYSGTGRGTGNGAVDDLGFAMGDGGTGATFSPGLNYADPSVIQLGGPQSWGYGLYISGEYPDDTAQDGFINRPSTSDSLAAAKLSATQKVSIPGLDSFEYGMRMSQRTKTLDDEGIFLTLRDYPNDVPVPEQFMLEPTSLDFIGMGDMISYDAQALYESGAYSEVRESKSALGRSVNSWLVKENVFQTYAMTNINAKIGSMPLLGNAGVQAVYTDQSSRGYLANEEPIMLPDGSEGRTVVRTQNRDGDKYWNFLPSMNLTLGITSNQKLRVGAARVLARPRMDQMNASSRVQYDPTLSESDDINMSPWSGYGGNPRLRPWMTWQFDTSYEYYFDQGGYLAVAGYYKHLSTFPFDQSVVRDFTNYARFIDDAPVLNQGLITAPENVGTGRIYGVEVAAAMPLDALTKSLKGFGLLFSTMLADSSVKDGTPEAEAIDLPGFSSTVINATAYYERYGFQARASVRYRSTFLGEISGLSLVRDQRFVRAETLVDAQISYDLSRTKIKQLRGLSVQLQGYNLSNQPFTSYHGNDLRLVRDYQNYGRTILLGVVWKDIGAAFTKKK